MQGVHSTSTSMTPGGTSSTRRDPRPGLGLPLIGGVLGGAAMLGVLAGVVGTPALALLAPFVVVLCAVWPAAGVIVLLAACALDRFAVSVGGPNVRPDELAALALAAALTLRVVFPPHRQTWLGRAVGSVPTRTAAIEGGRPDPLSRPLPAYLTAALLSTIGAGEGVGRALGQDAIALDLVLLYAALVWTLSTPARVARAVWIWLAVAAVEAMVGAGTFVHYLAVHGPVPGVQIDVNTGGTPLVYGTLYEGNIFGSYMSAAFLLALAVAAGGTPRRKLPVYLACVLTAGGLLLSNTRSAWGATIVGAVLLLPLLRMGRAGRGSRTALRFAGGLAAVLLVVGVGLVVAPSSVTGSLGTRAQGLLNFGSGSGYGRVLLYQEALAEWQTQPLLGLGPGSFAYRLPGDTSTGPAWLPNLTLQALHDTGVVGLAAMVWLFAAFYITTVRALRRAPPGTLRSMLAGLIAAVTALLISFQLTPGFELGYAWALLALGVAAARAVSPRGAGHE